MALAAIFAGNSRPSLAWPLALAAAMAFSATAEGRPGGEKECRQFFARAVGAASADSVEDPLPPGGWAELKRFAQAVAPALQAARFERGGLSLERTREFIRANASAWDGENGFELYRFVLRYLLVSGGTGGRHAILASALEIGEAAAQRLVYFVSQLDTIASRGRTAQLEGLPWFVRSQSLLDRVVAFGSGRKIDAPEFLSAYLRNVVAPVVGRKAHYLRLSWDANRRVLAVSSPVGVYRVRFVDRPGPQPPIPDIDVALTTRLFAQNDRIMSARRDVPVDLGDYERETDAFRALSRGDPYLHPHQPSQTQRDYFLPARLSPLQTQLADDLMRNDSSPWSKTPNGPKRRGLMMPTGEGKTVVVGGFLRRIERAHGRPKVVLIVENREVLKQSVESLMRDLKLDASRVFYLAGTDDPSGVLRLGPAGAEVKAGTNVSPSLDFDLVVTTRSTYSARRSTFRHLIATEKARSSPRAFEFVIDEAHHVGAFRGEFQAILDELETSLDRRDGILFVSATMWHPDVNLIRDFVGPRVVASHLTRPELERLRLGEDVERLARFALMRAMLSGYVAPVSDLSRTLTYRGRSLAQMLSRGNPADADVYEHVAGLIKALRNPGFYDRGIVFEIDTRRADQGADFLNAALLTSGERREIGPAVAIHSLQNPEVSRRNESWFEDPATRAQHKYAVTVAQWIEGVDKRGIRLLVVMRNVRADRVLIQMMGRGARLEPFKDAVTLIDASGSFARFFNFEELPEYMRWTLPPSGRAPVPRRAEQPAVDPDEIEDEALRPSEALAAVSARAIGPEERADRAATDVDARTAGAGAPSPGAVARPPTREESAVAERAQDAFFARGSNANGAAPVRPLAAQDLALIANWVGHLASPQAAQALRSRFAEFGASRGPGAPLGDADVAAAFAALADALSTAPARARAGFEPFGRDKIARPGEVDRMLAFLDPEFAPPEVASLTARREAETARRLPGALLRFESPDELTTVFGLTRQLRTSIEPAWHVAQAAVRAAGDREADSIRVRLYYTRWLANAALRALGRDRFFDMNSFFGLEHPSDYNALEYRRFPRSPEEWRQILR